MDLLVKIRYSHVFISTDQSNHFGDVLQILCLPTGERLFVKDDYFRLLFETSDLSNASPIALAHCVSYCNTLYIVSSICTGLLV